MLVCASIWARASNESHAYSSVLLWIIPVSVLLLQTYERKSQSTFRRIKSEAPPWGTGHMERPRWNDYYRKWSCLRRIYFYQQPFSKDCKKFNLYLCILNLHQKISQLSHKFPKNCAFRPSMRKLSAGLLHFFANSLKIELFQFS